MHSNPEESLDQPYIVHSSAALLLLALLSTPQSDNPKPTNPYTAWDVPKLLKFIVDCQRSNGSFGPFPTSTEQDVRFVYCATAICAIWKIDPKTVIDVQSTVDFSVSCRRYNGGYGQAPFLKSQGEQRIVS
ncbi:uncharacterized protein MELLADRAFT_61143 [Melampsora larici-populina 98AG31]|uniref:Prenyltransferase alpha-alpha toroid domain-containing protein n=1 Tax=Melampsora larici-populina (strain 98AG31 / pathotype 3-4-7) TaxID=747676 RepID=F4RDS4_MELLP|nr:uncharacterized protein MELLADRAFT_61143 [Melampsora larici-populina 98AG31]EGG09451.1 hypothetical protein MELLADRAFT_61143 [Melampsora larici-populina 98AG31]